MTTSFPPRFARTVDLYGPDGFARLRGGGALVIGLGGVGAHCAVALARSGIGRLKLLDHDRITISSLNRHPVAEPQDVGRLKTEILASWIARVCPDTRVEAVVARVEDGNVGMVVPPVERELFPVLIDCIDDVEGKSALLGHGAAHGWQVLSSMGAAGKRDAGQVRTGDLFATGVCPLAKAVRQRTRKMGVRPGQVSAVWSCERPIKAERGEQPSGRPEISTVPDRHRRLPSNQMLPGVFGFALAAMAIEKLCEDG
jgi:tRNA threonylcarbamoyladenosine dehydratase